MKDLCSRPTSQRQCALRLQQLRGHLSGSRESRNSMRRPYRRTPQCLSRVVPQVPHVTRLTTRNNGSSYRAPEHSYMHHIQRYVSFKVSPWGEYPELLTALHVSSKRVRDLAGLRSVNIYIYIYIAIDVPFIAAGKLHQRPTMKTTGMLGIPPSAINLRSADEWWLVILGRVRLNATFETSRYK